MSQVLSKAERELLSRHHDGELTKSEREQAEALLEASAPARVFVGALEELRLAARYAEEELWEVASLPSAQIIAELARSVADAAQSLEELAPLLERFHDGEVDGVERAFVVALINERSDVADYLATLDGLSTDFKELSSLLGSKADFGGFWDRLEARLDEAPSLPRTMRSYCIGITTTKSALRSAARSRPGLRPVSPKSKRSWRASPSSTSRSTPASRSLRRRPI
jgi:hypothetical protein